MTTFSKRFEFVYDLLGDKLNKAVPTALVIASTGYQLSLPRTESVQAYLDAVTIAHKLQVDPSVLPTKRAAAADHEATPATAQTSAKKGKFKIDCLAALSNSALMDALSRCPDWGWLPR